MIQTLQPERKFSWMKMLLNMLLDLSSHSLMNRKMKCSIYLAFRSQAHRTIIVYFREINPESISSVESRSEISQYLHEEWEGQLLYSSKHYSAFIYESISGDSKLQYIPKRVSRYICESFLIKLVCFHYFDKHL